MNIWEHVSTPSPPDFYNLSEYINLLQKGEIESKLFTDKYNLQTTRPSTSGLSLLPDTAP